MQLTRIAFVIASLSGMASAAFIFPIPKDLGCTVFCRRAANTVGEEVTCSAHWADRVSRCLKCADKYIWQEYGRDVEATAAKCSWPAIPYYATNK
ncbi:hypothetical protein EDB81DRAFT_789390 [Dactylonectria macrodidyma]|uniref:Uncharacterized protein n=1 Tax=Dactylonectria macrodidyma TaxID=307937 RepID=A0A9P9F5I7_9HYPO|nr:hypothetical protein EDB81DRAFT_789390 [Dactylonectria macrodidyma]